MAEPDGTVIFGGTTDKDIPLGELKQAFDLSSNIYNRSFDNLSVDNATEFFDSYVLPLSPERILLHIGEADTESFEKNSLFFDTNLHKLISHMKSSAENSQIVIISLKNPKESPVISEINKHLKYIAQSECCEFIDISVKRVWNPEQTKDIVSFLYLTGLNIKRPLYDLAKILFCYNNTCSKKA